MLFDYTKLTDDELTAELDRQGVMTAQDVANSLDVSLTTGKKKLKEIFKLFPKTEIKLSNKKIEGKIYGPRKPIHVLPAEIFEMWYQYTYHSEEDQLASAELEDEKTITEFKEELAKKSKEQLIDELALKLSQEQLRESKFE